MSSSSFTFRSAAQRRPIQSANDPTSSSDSLRPAQNLRPVSHFLAFGFILVLGSLQFLPATHFRDPSDPFRTWIPFNSNLSASFNETRAAIREKSELGLENGRHDAIVHIVSWMDCMDLRLLAILANSTLSSSRQPECVHFHFFIPEGHDDKVSYYKLKVLFPHSNLEILGQAEVKDEIMKAYSVGDYSGPAIHEIAPFVIPIVHSSLRKFIYVSPNVIMKGRVEELVGFNLSNYAVALADDCSKRLSTTVNSDVIDAIQRSASKPWVSKTPYVKNACMPDLGLVLIDTTKSDEQFLEAVLWWSKVLNRSERSSPDPAVALALYSRHLTLPKPWKITNLISSETNDKTLVLRYVEDGNICSAFNGGTLSSPDMADILKQYVPPMTDRILGS